MSPKEQKATRLEKFAWCSFDFANSSFTTVITTVVFARYFVGVIIPGPRHLGLLPDTWWAWANGLAQAVVLVSAPLVGALADRYARKKRYLFRSYILCVLGTASLSLCGPGDAVLASVLIILATTAFASGENLIAGFLPELAPPEELGRLSGYGWTLGYFGGLFSLVIALSMAKAGLVRETSLATAAFFALAGLPTFLFLRERAIPRLSAKRPRLIDAFSALRTTWDDRRRFRDLFTFLGAILFFQAGVAIVISFSAIFAEREIGMDDESVILLFIALQLAAAAGAFLFGLIQDRAGSKPALVLSLLIWLAAVAVALISFTKTTFTVSGILAGLAMGSSQSASRALVGLFCPRGREAEWFGLWGLATKSAAILGMLGYGAIVLAGDRRLALGLSAGTAFVIGLVILLQVDVQRGRRAATADPKPESLPPPTRS